jgi:hypothetical protein
MEPGYSAKAVIASQNRFRFLAGVDQP